MPESAVAFGVVGLGASWPALERRYDLTAGSRPGWSQMVRRQDADTLGLNLIRADVANGLVTPLRLANSRGRAVEVDLGAWPDAEVPGKVVRWRSIWNFAHLIGCASLKVAAAGYAGSIIGHATACAGRVNVETVDLGAERTGQPRIVVRYFTMHPGSTVWWDGHEGSGCVAAIGGHLQRIGFDGYWACNDAIRPYLQHQVGGTWIKPRAAGTNVLRDRTSCAIVYSSKATSADEAVMAALDLDRVAVQTAREDEDLYQFATRGAIRDPSYAGSYTIHVYDLGQAERLRDRLGAGGYADVAVEAVPDAGIMDVVRPTSTRKADPATSVETAAERKTSKRAKDAERKRRKRHADRAEMIRAGISPRGRGRPRRSA